MKESGVTNVPLEDLLKQNTIISLQCPLTPETQHLINGKTLSMMPEGGALINSSRGALTETKALIRALKKKKVGYLGIDVYEQEEHIFFRNLSEEIQMEEEIARLMPFPIVLITGH